MKKKIWAIIPARSGSQSVKNKNIIKVNKLPLIAYTIIQAKRVREINKVLVTSDSKKYLKIAKKYGADIIHLRSKKNSSNTASDLDFFKELTKFIKLKKYEMPSMFAHLRPNCPIRKISTIRKAINFFDKKYNYFTAMRSVSKMSETSYKTFEVKNGLLKGICGLSYNIEKMNRPKQFFKNTYMANGYIDILKVNNIINKNLLHGKRVAPFLINTSTVDIDSKNDLEYAKFLINKLKFKTR